MSLCFVFRMQVKPILLLLRQGARGWAHRAYEHAISIHRSPEGWQYLAPALAASPISTSPHLGKSGRGVKAVAAKACVPKTSMNKGQEIRTENNNKTGEM